MLSNAKVVPTLPVVDLDRARKFYRETLGLKEIKVGEMNDAYFQCGKGTELYIYQRGQTKADNTACSFEVDSLEDEMKELRGKGLVFEEYDFPGLKTVNGVAILGTYKAAWFKDTEGNILNIGQKV